MRFIVRGRRTFLRATIIAEGVSGLLKVIAAMWLNGYRQIEWSVQ
jgi:hypothetical protein